mgnify:CR=1 FL=1|jgi:hypothetical protein
MSAIATATGLLSLQARVVNPGGTTPAVLQRRLELVADAVSERYRGILNAPLMVHEGGSFSFQVTLENAPAGGLEGSARLVEMICELTLRLTPVRCHFALLRGAGSDFEPAFKEAREQRLFLVGSGFRGIDNHSITGAFAGIGVLLWGWTERQSQFVRALLREGVVAVEAGSGNQLRFVAERKRREIAAAFKVSPSVVTECLQAAQVKRFRYQVWAATDLLHRIVCGDA